MFRFMILFLFISAAHAEITPERGEYDTRVRIVDYNPMDVVKLTTFYGVSTHIEFDNSEKIKDYAPGDELACSKLATQCELLCQPSRSRRSHSSRARGTRAAAVG